MLTIHSISFLNWNDFFRNRLIDSDCFYLSQSFTKGHAFIEIFTSKKGDLRTTIEVGYLSDNRVIYLNILNPDTPGHNRQQLIEHFYKYQFSENKFYGDPGLDFSKQNLEVLYRQLSLGLNGKETLFYKNGKIVKSELILSYGTYLQQPSTFTHYFDNTPFLVRFLKRLLGVKEKYDVREVDLHSIFGGLPCG